MKASKDHHDHFIKTVLHRCVDLGWRESDMCRAANISKSGWSQIRNRKKSPTILTMIKILDAVNLKIQFSLHEDSKHNPHNKSMETRTDDDKSIET